MSAVRRIVLVGWLLLAGAALSAAEAVAGGAAAPSPAVSEKPAEKPAAVAAARAAGVSGSQLWRAFALLSEPERKRYLEIQRRDPAEFRRLMLVKIEEMRREATAREQRLQELVAAYRRAKSEEQGRLKAQISELVRANYQRRLRANRAQLTDLKRKVEHLTRELAKREQNADASIRSTVDQLLKPPPAVKPSADAPAVPAASVSPATR